VFWRLVFRLLRGNSGRLTVAILALVSGSAVISGLLNLEFGAEYQLTQQFRTLGANVVIAPKADQPAPESALGGSGLMSEDAVLNSVRQIAGPNISFAPFAYVIARAGDAQVVAVGTWLDQIRNLDPTWKLEGNWISSRDDQGQCLAGRSAAKQLHLITGGRLKLQYLSRSAECSIAGIFDSGAAEDNQVFMSLLALQTLADLPGKITLVQLNVGGGPQAIAKTAGQLSEALPQLQVRPVREVTEAEGALLSRIRLLIVSMIVLILILTALCVVATMAALAIERRADIGLMKALGGSISRIVGFFVAEVGLLGAAGGLIGAILGAVLSYWMGLRVFDTPILPRWEVFPVTIVLMTVVALAGVLPLRMLGDVKPAIMLRGD
jgi:putative ABC transport system permease protein